jgi:putative colanic acid biosynthesis acetyltransferase WcaF
MNLSTFSAAGFDRGAPRWKELLWVIIKCLFFLPSWPLPSKFRCTLLRLFGAEIGRGVVIRSKVNVWFPWRLTVGDHVWLGEDVFILNLAQVTIESDVCVSQRTFLCTGSHDFRRDDFALITKPIIIRKSSWIAANSFVGPGTEIESGSVVSAGSVVLRDVPANSIVQGNPAQTIKVIDRKQADSR